MRKSDSRLRQDGLRTKNKLIESAGQLSAQLGWQAVTSRMICEKAEMNPASVNYWFGSRDALYRAILDRVADTIFNQELEIEMVQYEKPEEAISFYFDYLIAELFEKDNWPLRVWLREVSSPTDDFFALVSRESQERILRLKDFFARYLGLTQEDIRLHIAFVSSLAVIFLLANVDSRLKAMMLPNAEYEPKAFIEALKAQIMRNLQATREAMP